jgi:hypothetical protein
LIDISKLDRYELDRDISKVDRDISEVDRDISEVDRYIGKRDRYSELDCYSNLIG